MALNQTEPSSIPKKHVLFIGNPGAGKSTLLNCLMLTRAKTNPNPAEKFLSGVVIGSGMTYQLDTKTQGDIVYMDTPGLSDTEKRKQAAESITEALKKDGEYQVVFVVTLEAGRVRPDDVTTMTLVLESAKEITHYGIVFNKIGDSVMSRMTKENTMVLLSQISMQNTSSNPLPIPLFVECKQELSDQDNEAVEILQLDEFVSSLPAIEIHKDNVDDIPADKYEALKEKLEKELTALRENNAALQKKLESDREAFGRQIEAIKEREPSFLQKLIGIAAEIITEISGQFVPVLVHNMLKK